MLRTLGKLAMHTTLTLGSAWLASMTYCKVSTYANSSDVNHERYKITTRGVGISMLMGATIGLGSSIIYHSREN
jgi:hypothetical protein